MQICRVYSNVPTVFEAIKFNFGVNATKLNVIIGEVHKPKDQNKDSHNLGKTTLIHVIDFLLLKGMSQEHLFHQQIERFREFEFFIEVALRPGEFATVRRSPANPTRASMSRYADEGRDFVGSTADDWDHPDLPIDEAIKLFDAWLDLRMLQPHDYRKAITYFLRAQDDWGDELQLQKFQKGAHANWKPFVGHLFGFDENIIALKYKLDDDIKDLERRQAEQQSEVQFSEDELPRLAARIAAAEQQVAELEEQLDAFSFDSEERRLIQDVVERVETEIASSNDRLYDIAYDIQQIDEALEHKDKFDLREVDKIFEEARVHLPNELKRQYEELVAFNKKVTQERNAALRQRKKALQREQEQLQEKKVGLDSQREQHLRTIRNTDSFDKFKSLQKEVSRQRADLVYMGEQRRKLEALAAIARDVREKQRERGRVVDEMKAMLEKPSVIFERFSATFNDYCKRVLAHEGIFYFHVNNSSNFDYKIALGLAGQTGKVSSQGEGTSYKKLVCALFDLALLKVYENAPFFHFVYHDGILEALDDRKKLAFLALVREQTATAKLQYIMTLIASDLPRDADGKVVNFKEGEIVLRLHDEGASGRLFKMEEF